MSRARRYLARCRDAARLEREDRDGLALGALTVALLVLVDLCYRRHTNLSATLLLPPMLTAALARPSAVAAVGTLSFGSAAGLAAYDPSRPGVVVRLTVVAAGVVVAVVTARHRRRLFDRSLRLKSIAEAAESALLRPLPQRVGPASMAGWHATATSEARVGGDFYEAVPYGSRARWIVGDARGHGVEALRLGAAAVSAFREAASRLEALEDVARRVEESLVGFLGDEDFVTAVFAELDRHGNLTLVNCGHPAPRLLGAGPAEALSVGGTTPLGIEPDLAGRSVRLAPGDSVYFGTDGLDEVRTPAGRGLEAARLGRGLGARSAEDAVRLIRQRVRSALGGDHFQDDVSVVVVKYEPQADTDRPGLRLVRSSGDQPGSVSPPMGASTSPVK